ncbi:hypothetical protein [Pontibacter rugosus]|uniref:Uncharacterized protein n=1 Tax=Pontibacter rugosus TaxID=1745966 RepID=A0ABW3STN1_9BACT
MNPPLAPPRRGIRLSSVSRSYLNDSSPWVERLVHVAVPEGQPEQSEEQLQAHSAMPEDEASLT